MVDDHHPDVSSMMVNRDLFRQAPPTSMLFLVVSTTRGCKDFHPFLAMPVRRNAGRVGKKPKEVAGQRVNYLFLLASQGFHRPPPHC